MEETTFVQRKKGNPDKEMSEMTSSKQYERNWLELPSDVTANILHRIGVVDILENAQKVCTTWRKICKDPSMWRVVHMKKISGLSAQLQKMCKHDVGQSQGQYLVDRKKADFADGQLIQQMCKHAVDRSQGQLVEIKVVDFACEGLLQYVADRSSQLKRLEFVSRYRGGHWNWTQALKRFPMLEELNLYKIKFSKEAIETASRCCPMLKTLKVNQATCKYWHGRSREKSLMLRNRTAKAIGENLHELRHLELIGNNMTNIGLQAILDGCRHLELLDLRGCLYTDLWGDLGKKCSEKIKCLKLPRDSLKGCLYYRENDNDCKTCEYDHYVWDTGVDIEYWINDDSDDSRDY